MNGFGQLLKQYGLPTALAVVLLAVLLGWVAAPALDVKPMLLTHVQDTRELKDVLEHHVRLLQAICRASYTLELGRQECN